MFTFDVVMGVLLAVVVFSDGEVGGRSWKRGCIISLALHFYPGKHLPNHRCAHPQQHNNEHRQSCPFYTEFRLLRELNNTHRALSTEIGTLRDGLLRVYLGVLGLRPFSAL